MKSIKHLIGASVILMMAFAFNACTTDSDVVQISESELESEDIGSSSSSEKAETKAKSSSSKKEAKSSSSKKENKEKAEDAESKDKSSSSVKDDDSKVSSSSKADDKEEAKSSSSARKIRVPGIEDPDEVDAASSSSKTEKADSTAAKPETTSSTEAAKDTIDKDTTSVIKDNNEMDKLDSNEQEVLDSLISSGDTSITKIDSLVIDKDSLDFDNNEYLCKAPDGNWYRLNESKAKTFWKLLWDLTVYIFTGHHYYDFTKACDELYMRPKN